jgi:hypothetical protein
MSPGYWVRVFRQKIAAPMSMGGLSWFLGKKGALFTQSLRKINGVFLIGAETYKSNSFGIHGIIDVIRDAKNYSLRITHLKIPN